jgi:hypothetical protein
MTIPTLSIRLSAIFRIYKMSSVPTTGRGDSENRGPAFATRPPAPLTRAMRRTTGLLRTRACGSRSKVCGPAEQAQIRDASSEMTIDLETGWLLPSATSRIATRTFVSGK